MNFRKAGLLIVGVLLVALYVLNRKDVILQPLQPLQVRPVSASGFQFEQVIELKNPNLLSSTIKTFHEKFYINGVLLGILDNDLNQGIPGLKETGFPVKIRFSKTDYGKAMALDSLNKNASIVVTGDIEFQNLFTSGKIDIHQSVPVITQPVEK